MIFEQVRHGGCLSYLIGCEDTRNAILVDPELDEADRYLALAAEKGIRVRYLLDTHTHADHFTATRQLGKLLSLPIVMHRRSVAPFVDLRVEDGETLIVGKLRLRILETPGHTDDSMCLVLADRILTGDTLLIGGTGRTDLPTGDPEALRTNRTGGKTVKQLIAEAAREIAFMSMDELRRQIERATPGIVLLDVREREAFRAQHLPGARNIPRGELELRADRELPDPTARILTYCQVGKISTLAAHTLRTMGYQRTVALDGGLDAWIQAGYPLEGNQPQPANHRQ